MCMKKYNLSQNDSKETIIAAQFKLVLTAYYTLLFMEPVLELPVMVFRVMLLFGSRLYESKQN